MEEVDFDFDENQIDALFEDEEYEEVKEHEEEEKACEIEPTVEEIIDFINFVMHEPVGTMSLFHQL